MALLENILYIMGSHGRKNQAYNNCPKHLKMFLLSISLHSPLLDNLALELGIKCTVDGGEAISAPSVGLASCIPQEF